MSWETVIRTGDPAADGTALEDARRLASSQGLVVQASPLPGGGYHVRAFAGAPGLPAPGAVGPWQASAPALNTAGTFCQLCHRNAEVRQVTLMRNIGVLVIRFPRTLSGLLCRHCVDKYFWEYTAVTMFLGWWGLISFVYTLIALPTNFVGYLRTRSLPAPAEDQASLQDKRSRGTWMTVLGSVGALFALVWMALSALAIVGSDDDATGGIVALLIGIVILLVPSTLMFIVGVRTIVAGRAAPAMA
jgi:hypothetical protein